MKIYKVTEFFKDGFEIYELTADLAEYVFGRSLWQAILVGRWSNLYQVEIIS